MQAGVGVGVCVAVTLGELVGLIDLGGGTVSLADGGGVPCGVPLVDGVIDGTAPRVSEEVDVGVDDGVPEGVWAEDADGGAYDHASWKAPASFSVAPVTMIFATELTSPVRMTRLCEPSPHPIAASPDFAHANAPQLVGQPNPT